MATMEVTCRTCDEDAEVGSDDLPGNARDTKDWECPTCGEMYHISWDVTAYIELKL